jgi:queuine tRNA-ribosyltransferase
MKPTAPPVAPTDAPPFRFTLEATSDLARAGTLETPHGPVHTPAFMPVGTHGALKAMTPAQVADTGAEVVLANTYHLALRPGEGLVEKLGGLHAFMQWPGPILTDSGGFQVFSLPGVEISDKCATFDNEVRNKSSRHRAKLKAKHRRARKRQTGGERKFYR